MPRSKDLEDVAERVLSRLFYNVKGYLAVAYTNYKVKLSPGRSPPYPILMTPDFSEDPSYSILLNIAGFKRALRTMAVKIRVEIIKRDRNREVEGRKEKTFTYEPDFFASTSGEIDETALDKTTKEVKAWVSETLRKF